jgi:uncharacterized protein YraI
MRMTLATTALATFALSGAAFAQTMATAGTDLNIRSGPGVQHEVTGSIRNGDEVSVNGCIDSVNWCEVVYNGQTGWAYGDYLTTQVGEEIQPLYPNRQEVGVTIIEAPAQEGGNGQDAAVGSVTGAAMGALVGGPIGAVAGAALGGAAGSAAAPEPAPEIRTYITNNTVDPVILEGEVVVGAGVPENVPLYDVTDYPDYRYATINGQNVLVDPTSRQIVYIYR